MRTLMLALALLTACDKLKPKVVTQIQVDNGMAKGDYEIVCIGLKMVKNDELRTYTAQQLVGVPSEVADKCLCEALQPKEDGTWDEAVATGLRGSPKDSAVTCLADLVKRPEIQERVKALNLLARTKAPIARATSTVSPTTGSLPSLPGLRRAASPQTTSKIFSFGLPVLSIQPLTIWMRSRLPPCASFIAANASSSSLDARPSTMVRASSA